MVEYKICYGSWEELDRNEARREGDIPYIPLSVIAQKMLENDPTGEKALELAKKYGGVI